MSSSVNDMLKKIGYKSTHGNNCKTLLKRLEEYEIDISHFSTRKHLRRLTQEIVFQENSDVSQNTLRRWYKRISDDTTCSICGMKNNWNGKLLVMILDHINGVNTDNRIDNLRWVCPNCNSQLPTFTGRNPARKGRPKRIQKVLCPVCGKNVMTIGSSMCIDCYVEKMKKQRPTKDTLESVLKTMTYAQIAGKYNVSTITIKRWCKQFGLPYRKKDIQKWVNGAYNPNNPNDGDITFNDNDICEAYLAGKSLRTIAQMSHKDVTTIKAILSRYNIGIRSPGELQRAKVAQIDPITKEIVAIYESVRDANRKLGDGLHITDVCNGKRKATGGFEWKYYDDL